MERREKSKERKRRKKRKKKEKEKKAKPRYVFVLNSWVFWISYGLVWRLVLLWSRVLWRNHINPRILEVMRVKPQLVKIKHGIIIIIWFYIELVNLGLNSYEFLDFHLGFCGMNFQITNSSVVVLF